jgi:DNA-binding Xre family transcriptional regulator
MARNSFLQYGYVSPAPGSVDTFSMAKRVRNTPSHVQPRFKQRRRIWLKEWREYRDLTQEQLAERVGWSVGNVSQLERGLQGYSQEGLEALAEALHCDPGQLLTVDPSKDDAIWSIWERAKPGERQMIIELAKTVVKTGT